MEETRAVPSLTLTAAGSGRTVQLDQVTMPTVALIFGQDNSGAVDPVVAAIRARYSEDEVLIVSIVDLSKLPRLLRKMAEGMMAGRYKAEAAKLREGLDPVEHVVILPDWDGDVARGFGLSAVDKQLAVAVLAPGGQLAALHQDASPENAIVGLLEPVVGS